MTCERSAAGRRTSVAQPPIGPFKSFDKDVQSLVKVVFRDNQWCKQPHDVVVRAGLEYQDTSLVTTLEDGPRRELRRLLGLLVHHEFDGDHRAEAAHLTDNPERTRQRIESLPDNAALIPCSLKKIRFGQLVKHGDRGGACNGVTA